MAGAAWKPEGGLAAAELALPADDDPFLRLGGEWRWQAGAQARLALRGGWRTETAGGLGAWSGLSFGAGLARGPWELDFSVSPYEALGDSCIG